MTTDKKCLINWVGGKRLLRKTIPLTIKLMCEYPGIVITIPKNATFNARKEYVLNHYDGSKDSRLFLSKVCGFLENYIYRIANQR